MEMVANVVWFLTGSAMLMTLTVMLGFPAFVACLLAALVVRSRVPGRVLSLLLAASFAASGFYGMYRMEWYDVWRHGVPSLSYLARLYLPIALIFGGAGWLAGRAMTPSPFYRRRSAQ